MVNTAERRAFTRFTSHYLDYTTVIVVRNEARDVSTLDDLNGKKVAIVKGYYYADTVSDKHPGVDVVAVPGFLHGLSAVMDGQVDAFIGGRIVVRYTINKHVLAGLRIAGSSGIDDPELSKLHMGSNMSATV